MIALDMVVDRDLCAKRMQEVYDHGVSSMEGLILTKTGEQIPYFFTGNRMVVNGKTYLVGVGLDITERKKFEKEIASLAKFPEEDTNPVYRVSKDGVLLYANSASRKMILEDQTKIGDKIPKKWIKHIRDIYNSGKKEIFEHEFNGKVFYLIRFHFSKMVMLMYMLQISLNESR